MQLDFKLEICLIFKLLLDLPEYLLVLSGEELDQVEVVQIHFLRNLGSLFFGEHFFDFLLALVLLDHSQSLQKPLQVFQVLQNHVSGLVLFMFNVLLHQKRSVGRTEHAIRLNHSIFTVEVEFRPSRALHMERVVAILEGTLMSVSLPCLTDSAQTFKFGPGEFVHSLQYSLLKVQLLVPQHTAAVHPNEFIQWLALQFFFCEFVALFIGVIHGRIWMVGNPLADHLIPNVLSFGFSREELRIGRIEIGPQLETVESSSDKHGSAQTLAKRTSKHFADFPIIETGVANPVPFGNFLDLITLLVD